MIFGLSGKGAGRKTALRGALAVLLEKDGKVLFEFSASSLEKPIVIGRGAECDWSVAGVDPSMSGRHAELFAKHGALRIRDLGSRNGLYFHGERIQERRLQAGDEILLGACSLSVERAKSASAEDESPRYNRLEQLNGPDAGRIVNLVGPADVVIGSDPSCSIICADTLVSHRHAVISFKPDGSCWVSDLGSRNGSAVNGVTLKKERMLRDGDVLKIAYLEFRFFDKGVVHAHAHIGRTVAIAVATVAVALTGYFIWNSLTDSAKTFVKRAQEAAAIKDFDKAFAYLDQAAVSRYHDDYADIIREQRQHIAVWTNSISKWDGIMGDLAKELWMDAVRGFTTISDWEAAFGWNMEDAVKSRKEAVLVKALLDRFIKGREMLGWKWDKSVPDEFADFADGFAEAMDAALETVSTNRYCDPLYAASGDLLKEFRDTIADFVFIEDELGKLNTRKAFPGELHAGRLLGRLEARKKEYDARGERRKRQQEEDGLRYLRFSRLPGERFQKAVKLVESLYSAELDMDANVEKIAVASKDKDYDIVTHSLPLPSEESCDEFRLKDYRSSLKDVNDILSGRVLEGLRTQMKMLEDCCFIPENTNATFKLVLDAATTDEILRFVPERTKPPDARNWVCMYDRFVGVDAFVKFLNSLDKLFVAEMSRNAGGQLDKIDVPSEKVAACIGQYYSRYQPKRWKTLLLDVKDGCDILAQFESTVEEESGLSRAIRDRSLPGGANRVKAAAGIVRGQIEDFEDWLDDFCEECGKNTNPPRVRVLGLGVALLLGDPAKPSSGNARKLWETWAELRASVPTDENGTVGEWRAIMEKDLPGTSGFNEAWRNLYDEAWQGEDVK